ncbi:MAG TPA: choice-of-anchor Q domain-containing protein, partial [Thermoanaerobaculia bacterium]|nr:choice-of-anchor Q domain-containing protein [Thermoanaerobaculia bacterium]
GGGGGASASGGPFAGDGGTTGDQGNGAGGGGGLGGVLFNHFGAATLVNSTLTGNTAAGGDGGGSAASNHRGGGGGAGLGGAVFNLDGTVTVESSTLAGNTVVGGAGGGVSGQDSQGAGGAIFHHFQDDGVGNSIVGTTADATTLTLEDSILADSTADPADPPDPNTFGATNDCLKTATTTVTLQGANLIQSNADDPNACGTATLSDDPQLSPLADNGGPTETMAIGTASPAFDAAGACPPPATDQRGVARPQGAACDLGAFELAEASLDRDFGDAPDPFDGTLGAYPTLAANDGARHVLSAGLFLGECADAEPDGQPTGTADGDDLNTGSPVVGTCAVLGDDEDGVVFTSGLVQGGPATLEVTASPAGLLDAWIDWNADGDWDDAGEQVFTSESLAAGANSLGFTVPAGATPGTTFARFRLSSAGGLAPTGFAADGEVEDYQVTVEPAIQISIDDVSGLEGDAGTTPFAFTVSVSSTSIEVQVTAQTADGSATAGEDYIAVPATVLTFPQGGPLTQTVTVQVIGDTTVEPDETFTVELSSPSPGAVITDGTGLGTIEDDDAFKADVVGTKEVTGGDLARGGTVIYTVVLTNLGPGLQQDNPEDEFVDVLPPELLLVSASADSGVTTADPGTNTVTWNGEIPAGAMVTILIEAAISEEVPLGTAIANQGTIFYDADGFATNEATRSTDDPSTPEPEDPTVFLVGAASLLEIPTLTEWALWLLALTLAGLGVGRLRG